MMHSNATMGAFVSTQIADLTNGTIGELAARLRDGTLSAAALLEDCLARIVANDRQGATLSALLRVDASSARKEAREQDAQFARTGQVLGPLHGIPLVVKDNIDVRGVPTTSGNPALSGAVALRDAAQTQRLKQAGAIILGKANLSEFSFEVRSRSSLGGDVLNPFNTRVTAGGSSGGTAAAVAAGFAVAGLGT